MDNLVLQALRTRQQYDTLIHCVPEDMMAGETQTMLLWFKSYYQRFPEATEIDMQALAQYIRLSTSGGDPDSVAITLHLVDQLDTEVNEELVGGIVSKLRELDYVGRAAALVSRYNAGEDIDISYEMLALTAECRREMTSGGVSKWEDASAAELMDRDKDDGGLQLTGFGPLGLSIKGLHGGKNIAVAAPTDMGKTSMMSKLVSIFLLQGIVLYPGRPLLYLVNEGTADVITLRIMQTVMGMDRPEMQAAIAAGTFDDDFNRKIGGRSNLRVKNIHGKNMAQVDQIIQYHNPYMVVSDMTGRIKAVSNRGGGMNDIGQLEEVWNHMRELSAIHNFLHMGSIQVSAEGFNMLYPPLSALQNSKTGIQTTLDLILMMGALGPTSSTPNLRGISTPKNKLARAGMKSMNMFEMNFKAERNEWETGHVEHTSSVPSGMQAPAHTVASTPSHIIQLGVPLPVSVAPPVI